MSINLMKNLYKELSRNIEFIINKSLIYNNRKRLKGLTLKERDLVYLLRKNIRIKRLSMKLDYIKLHLYKIQKVLSIRGVRIGREDHQEGGTSA
jgi:hypothetical protein